MKANNLFKRVALAVLCVIAVKSMQSQSCDLDAADKRRTQVLQTGSPPSYAVHMTMKRGKSYNGTAFFIHPGVLLTAGHNLRKRPQFYHKRVKKLTLRFGSTGSETNLQKTELTTRQNNNIYTPEAFNNNYSIENDYGIVILPDASAYAKVGGKFELTVVNKAAITGKIIHLAGYPGDKPFCTLWTDATTNYFFYKNYMHYDFETEHGASGAPVWYDEAGKNKIFAIHTNGDGFDDYKCNTATLITQTVYDDIVRFCLSKGIDITE